MTQLQTKQILLSLYLGGEFPFLSCFELVRGFLVSWGKIALVWQVVECHARHSFYTNFNLLALFFNLFTVDLLLRLNFSTVHSLDH